MAKGKRICKICGEPYEYCKTAAPAGVNRWQDVACCIEHATQYFREVALSRGELVEEESNVEPVVEELNDEDLAELEDIVLEEAFENEIAEDSEDEF